VKRAEFSFQQIYNQLLAGQQLVLYFPDEDVAENFRTRLHHHKSKQEKVMEGLGFSSEEDRTQVRFKLKKNTNDAAEKDGTVAYISFIRKSPLRKYPVIILEPDDLKDEEISKDLGETKG
jgi:hypothetical protein